MSEKLYGQHQSNRAAWNEAAGQYKKDFEESVAFLLAGGTNFVPPEYEFLKPLMPCERAIHLQCAAGHDTLSLWNLGAREVIGVDISDEMIALAQKKSDALGAPARWFRSDILEAPTELNESADLVYTGRGALNWQMDIDAWAQAAATLVKPGGHLYVFEGHPMMWIWDMDAAEYVLDNTYGNYFDGSAHADQGWPTQYIAAENIVPEGQQATKYERQWTLAQLVNAVLQAGLVLEKLGEHPEPYWEAFPNIPNETLRRLPQTLSILARKPIAG